MPIVKPSEMDFSEKNIIMIISGLPGTGKTTLALSAPDVLLIDADEGICRVKTEHRKDASICKSYEEIKSDIEAAKGHYKTIVIDTAGALIDYLKDWAIRTDPKASKTNGGISLQGFGVVKQEFLRLSAELRKDFNVVFLFHESMTKNNEDIFYELVCEGSARTLVYQPADLAAHLFIQNGKRILGFTPTEQYTAKSAYGIKGLVTVPELKEGEENNFLAKLFSTVRKNLKVEAEDLAPKTEEYEKLMSEAKELVGDVQKPEDITLVLDAISKMPHVLTSEKEIKKMLGDRMKELNIGYDKKTKAYVYVEPKS